MGWWSVFLFGTEDEIKVKELMKIFDIKDFEEAKLIYEQIKASLGNK